MKRQDVNPSAPRGELWPLDRYGRAQNAGDLNRVSAAARDAALWTAQVCSTQLGVDLHSVYIVGSAARGRPGPFEMTALLRMTAKEHARGLVLASGDHDREAAPPLWLAAAADALEARFGDQEPVTLGLKPWRDVFPAGQVFSADRFRLGVSSACVYGRDLTRHIAPQRLSAAVSNHAIFPARRRIAEAAGRLALSDEETHVRREARMISRFMLSAAFALVMPFEGVYTEDLDLQRDLFALSYPARAADAATAAAFARCPPGSAFELLQLLDGFGRWLTAEADRWLDAHNPQRRAVLPL